MTHAHDQTMEHETRVESQVQARLGSRVRQLRVVIQSNGVVLQGNAQTYYGKQLAQHLVMEITNLLILANEIEVR
jgi:hypothetical protein